MGKRWIVIGSVVIILALATPAYAATSAASTRLWTAGELRQPGEEWRCVEVTAEDLDLNIRSGPGIAYGLVASRAPGDQFEADYSRVTRGDGYDWVPVRFSDGGQGWAITSRLAACPTTPAGPDTPPAGNGAAGDGTLDRFEIAALARSVVLVAASRGGRIFATGTGTITTPEGLIVTNAHVIEGADQIAVAVLDDINEPPEYRYMAEVIGYDPDIDVALLAIRTDVRGAPVQPDSLGLPFVPVSIQADDVFRGDMVYIFGFPGIGDDYLVVTTGTIVSVENGSIQGQTMPVWYRTDAEIAPGNSGGLVVNGNGEFVGIPTFVRSEEETGGRLGGIRPAEVALMSLTSDAAIQAAGSLAAGSGTTDTLPVTLDVTRVWLDHGSVTGQDRGLQIHVAFGINGWEGREAAVYAHFYHDTFPAEPVINRAAPRQYRDTQDAVITAVPITPCCAETVYDNLQLFIPYSAFGFTQRGAYPLMIQLEIVGDSWRRTLDWEFITVTVG